jgi:acyl carrier protein
MERFSSDKLKNIIAEVVGVSVVDIGVDSGMESVPRWDSFAVVSMVVAIEQEAGIEVGAEELEEFTTFQGILALLATKGIDVAV